MTRAAVCVAAALALAVTAGCSDEERSGPEPPPPPTLSGDPVLPGEGALEVLAPEGRFPRPFLAAFRRATGCRVTVTPARGAGDVRGRLSAAPDRYDLVQVLADEAGPLIHERRLASFDPRRVEGLGDLPDPFRVPAGTTEQGRRYGIGILWSAEVLLSARGAFVEGAPTSLRALYPAAPGARVAVPDDPLQLAVAARFLGRDDPFSLDDAELAASERVAALQRPHVVRYVRSPQETARLFRRGRIAIASGPPSVALEDPRVTATVPKEGALGHVEALLPVAGAPHPTCAYAFLSFAIARRSQASLARASRLAPVELDACPLLGRRLCTGLLADEPDVLRQVVWAERPVTPTSWPAWTRAWERATTRTG